MTSHSTSGGGAAFKELASELRRAATRLATTDGGGKHLAAAVRRVRSSLDTLETALDDFERGGVAGIAALEALLDSPVARKTLGVQELRRIAREAGAGRIVADKPAAARRELAARAAEKDAVEETTTAVRTTLALLRTVEEQPDAAALRREFLRLGGLDDATLESEARARYRTISAVRALARANAIRGATTADREALWKELIRQARRLRANLRHLPAA